MRDRALTGAVLFVVAQVAPAVAPTGGCGDSGTPARNSIYLTFLNFLQFDNALSSFVLIVRENNDGLQNCSILSGNQNILRMFLFCIRDAFVYGQIVYFLDQPRCRA